jgi:2,5-diketo-D-gluconate reductase A
MMLSSQGDAMKRVADDMLANCLTRHDDRSQRAAYMVGMREVPATILGGGVTMPMVGFGTWELYGEQAYNSVRYALDEGYRHIDTASVYKNEAQVGRAVRDSGLDRREVFLTTKVPAGADIRDRATIGDCLRALDTTYVDLLLIHWPPDGMASPAVWEDLLAARDKGQARAVGVSNYGLGQLDELARATGEAPAVNQIPWSPSWHDPVLLAGLRKRGVAVEGYSPLKDTDLGAPPLTEIAARHGVTPAQVVLRWHLEHGITVIPKSANRDRIKSNFALCGFSLAADEVTRLDDLAASRR